MGISVEMELTEEYLESVEKRAQTATAGPWISFIEGRDHTSGSSFIRTSSDDIELAGASAVDQDFIAHARQEIPLLVAEVRRLRKRMESCNG